MCFSTLYLSVYCHMCIYISKIPFEKWLTTGTWRTTSSRIYVCVEDKKSCRQLIIDQAYTDILTYKRIILMRKLNFATTSNNLVPLTLCLFPLMIWMILKNHYQMMEKATRENFLLKGCDKIICIIKTCVNAHIRCNL